MADDKKHGQKVEQGDTPNFIVITPGGKVRNAFGTHKEAHEYAHDLNTECAVFKFVEHFDVGAQGI